MANSCDYGIEPLDFIKLGGGVIGQMSDCQLLKEAAAPSDL